MFGQGWKNTKFKRSIHSSMRRSSKNKVELTQTCRENDAMTFELSELVDD